MVMRFFPLPPRAASKDKDQETWIVRQFREIKLVLDMLTDLAYADYVANLEAPLLLTEGNPFVDVVSLEGLAKKGLYEITLSFITQFNTQNDQVHFRLVIDGVPTATFIKEAKDATEALPFTYVSPLFQEGAFVITLQAFVQGGGLATATITEAHIFQMRMQ